MARQGKSYNDIDWKSLVPKYDNARIFCSICGWSIPAELQRHRFYKAGYRTTTSHTICGICLIQMAKKVNKRTVKKVLEKRLIDAL